MSKSVGNVADPIQAIDEFGIDLVRFYLARVGGRFKDDVDWSHEQLDKHAREITSLLGNLLMRITAKKIQERTEGKPLTPAAEAFKHMKEDSPTFPLYQTLQGLGGKVEEKMEQLMLAEVLEEIVITLGKANQLMTNTAPWAATTDTQTVIDLYPFMPSKADMLLDALGVPAEERFIANANLGTGSVGQIQTGIRLFNLPQRQKTM
ncbi:hypothetical protein EW026_g7624 [Hermanssonia centrifuga]|uniref:Methionyl/Leucyl tRNA synthetase domain-containing protein n=1 Tax=Hermanssonia centrifuga TaxID=98765 RepID=A0A4S4K884_9APHY|nr:hypothetical protein EW026_g7624 [Hermanssonia centrifuga]